MKRLTPLQVGALKVIEMRGRLQNGWGGYGMKTLRSLEARGLCRLDFERRDATSITEAGRTALHNLAPDKSL